MFYRRFRDANLRFNPFGELPPGERGRLVVGNLPPVNEHLEILADAGHGKSSSLLALALRHPEARYIYVPEGESSIDTTPVRLLLLDEAQRVRPRILRRMVRQGTTLVMGTHEPMANRLRVAVKRWPLPPLGLSRLRAIVDRRIAHAQVRPGASLEVSDERLIQLLERFQGNIRAIEDALYDAVQKALEDGHVRI
ncbi:MAG: hypothetical protein AAFQ82_16385 [Myxococcota bacterium]